MIQRPKIQLQQLFVKYDSIILKHSADIGQMDLITMTIPTPEGTLPVASKPYNLLLKHRDFLKEEIEALLKSGVIERSMSSYAAPIIVVPRKHKPGAPLKEMERLVIDYQELNKQLPWVQTVQTKSKGMLALIPIPKMEHLLTRIKGAKYFLNIELTSGYHHIPITKADRHKSAFTCFLANLNLLGGFLWNCQMPRLFESTNE